MSVMVVVLRCWLEGTLVVLAQIDSTPRGICGEGNAEAAGQNARGAQSESLSGVTSQRVTYVVCKPHEKHSDYC